MSLVDLFRISTIKAERDTFQAEATSLRAELTKTRDLLKEIGGLDLEQVREKIKAHEQTSQVLLVQCEDLLKRKEGVEAEIAKARAALVVVEEELLLESFALYKPKYAMTASADYKARLEEVRAKQKELIKADAATYAKGGWTVNGSESEGKKMIADMKRLLLRSFNNESDSCVENVKFNNVESFEQRIQKSFDALKKLGRIMDASISERYRQLKIEELHLAHEYQIKKQEEKEDQRRAREQLREQQKLEAEIRQARERIAKERKHFAAAIKQLEGKLSLEINPTDRADIEQKLHEIRKQAGALDQAEKEVDYREKNAKAGYVYVISNLGAFGENVFKIGMTRRLEPMDRVDELGDASVPFEFDVHALIFSEDAPALESKLHGHFESNRLNKLNRRKEFFRAEILEIEKVIRENYDKVFDLVKEAGAEQYRESLRL